MSRRADILNKITQVPRLPVAAIEALKALQDPENSVDAVVPTLAHDPGLTAAILRVANSAAFAGQRECTVLRDGLLRLGNERVRQVLVRAGLGPGAQKPLAGYGLAPGELLEHSKLVARGAVALGKLLRSPVAPAVFTAGLLHNIGKMVLGTWMEVDGIAIRHLAEAERLTFDEAERMVLGIDHAEVGAVLLESWGIPAEIVTAVRWHHLPEWGPEPRLAARLIHLADSVVIHEGVGAGVDGEFYPPCSETVEALRFTPSVALELARDLRADRKRLGRMFGFATPTQTQVEVVDPHVDDSEATSERGPVMMQRLLGFMFARK